MKLNKIIQKGHCDAVKYGYVIFEEHPDVSSESTPWYSSSSDYRKAKKKFYRAIKSIRRCELKLSELFVMMNTKSNDNNLVLGGLND